MEFSTIMTLLDNWAMVGGLGDYRAPEQATMHLSGAVWGHSDHIDGTNVVTSQLLALDLETGTAVTSSGTLYELGAPSEEWLKWLHDTGQSLKVYGFNMRGRA